MLYAVFGRPLYCEQADSGERRNPGKSDESRISSGVLRFSDWSKYHLQSDFSVQDPALRDFARKCRAGLLEERTSAEDDGGYLEKIFLQSSTIWIILAALAIVLLIISIIRFAKTRLFSTLTYIIIWLILGSIFSYGTYLIFPVPYYLLRPRYEYGLGIFLAIILVVGLEFFKESKFLLGLKSFISGLLVFYFLSFSFVYTSSLKQQNEMF